MTSPGPESRPASETSADRGGRSARDVAVFLIALAARLAFLFLVDEPLLYRHQYNYFQGGLSVAADPHPWAYVLRSDAWHQWGAWTMAPLYHLFVAMVFRVFGAHLVALQVVQCVLDALVAVLVARLGGRVSSRWGVAAGLAYALYWPSVEFPSRTYTENLHTVLLVAAFSVVAGAAGSTGRLRPLAGGFLLGLSALARAVSAAFLPVAALIALCARAKGERPRMVAATLVLLGGAAAIIPWTARNVWVIGDPLLIEDVAFFNLWTDNGFVDRDRYEAQAHILARQPTPAARRALATRMAWRGLVRRPGDFPRKVFDNFEHFFRPEGLHGLLAVEDPRPGWRHAAQLVLDDALLVGASMLFLVFLGAGSGTNLGAGRPETARVVWRLLAFWTAYYLFMVVVVFHNEIRYRSAFVPFAFAGAVGGLELLAAPAARKRAATRLAAVAALAFGAFMVGPYVAPAWRAARAAWELAPAREALGRGDLAAADGIAYAASSRDRGSPRPWLTYGRWLAFANHPAEASEAYRRAALRRAIHWVPRLVLPRLLHDAGRLAEAEGALVEADELSAFADPWLALEVAWRELPAPVTDEIRLGRGDYGAVRGFLQKGDDHRWTRHLSYLRLVPHAKAAAFDVTLVMGSPEPSPITRPRVSLDAGAGETSVMLAPEVRSYLVRGRAGPDGVLVVEIRSPTWCRAGYPAEQGIRVDRMTVAPARE